VVAIKTLLGRDPCVHANTAIEMIDAILKEHPVAPKPWVWLTDKEIDLFINGRGDADDDNYVEPTGDGFGLTDADLLTLVRRAESKLKEKNHD
jgi:hypothetical protein